MRSLRVRLVVLFVGLALVVAGAIVVAVLRFSADEVMGLFMEGAATPEEAQAMFDLYVARVLLIGAAIGIVVGSVAAWWLIRRVLRPLDRLTEATHAVAAGDLGARVPEPPDAELRRLADAFNEMAASLERMERLRRALVEDVAHELRTPLTSLRGYTEALSDGVVEPTPEMLRNVHDEIERLTSLVEGLDQLARGERQARERTRVEVDLVSVVRRVLELTAPELDGRGITVRIEAGDGVPRLLAEPVGMGQVVTNLIQNAARYTDDGGEITVRLRGDGTWLLCAIENTGTPIPPDQLPLIWERLYRVDPSRTRTSGGAGIGLAIVRQIVEAHGGTVGASSEAMRTSIWFRLPASPAPTLTSAATIRR
jgi:two-component system, OmpR family, sensor histidine kinase BaeS